MFKSLIVYRIAQDWAPDLQAAEEALAKAPFMECGATQEKSIGWVPPRGEAHGALVESIGGQWIARLMAVAKHGTTEAFSATLAGVLQRAELSIA